MATGRWFVGGAIEILICIKQTFMYFYLKLRLWAVYDDMIYIKTKVSTVLESAAAR